MKRRFSQITRKMPGTHRMISAMNCFVNIADHGVDPVKYLVIRIVLQIRRVEIPDLCFSPPMY